MATDKSKTLMASIRLLNEKLHFEGKVDGNEPVSIDYTPPLGDNLGYTSLELFLLSLSSCVGSAILVMLRKMKKNIDFFEINSTGYRNSTTRDSKSGVTLAASVILTSYGQITGNIERCQR